MSHYIERECLVHGEWLMDVDRPGECPQCPSDEQRIAELERELAAAQATIEQTRSVLEGCLDEFGFVSARYHSKIVKALALPTNDRTALDAMLKEAEKRGRQWQPIETAPKDEEIWAFGMAAPWSGSRDFIWQGQAGWNEEDKSWWTTSHDDTGKPLKVSPTHWMPLPEPPAIRHAAERSE